MKTNRHITHNTFSDLHKTVTFIGDHIISFLNACSCLSVVVNRDCTDVIISLPLP